MSGELSPAPKNSLAMSVFITRSTRVPVSDSNCSATDSRPSASDSSNQTVITSVWVSPSEFASETTEAGSLDEHPARASAEIMVAPIKPSAPVLVAFNGTPFDTKTREMNNNIP